MIMNKEIKGQWVQALESGDYAQTCNILHDEGGFCCLGVLSDLYIKAHPNSMGWKPVDSKASYKTYKLNGTTDVLPNCVMRWADLEQNDPVVSFLTDNGFADRTLSSINDAEFEFNFIAQLIKAQL